MKKKSTNIIGLLLLGLLASAAIWVGVVSEKTPETKEEGGAKLLALIEARYEQEFLMTRDISTNTVPRERLLTAYRIAQQRRAEMAQLKDSAIPIYWHERGPNNVGGRTRGLIFDANDPMGHTVWAAGVAGGLWRTTNIDAAAPTWTLVDDFFANLAITTIAQDPSNSNILYFGTGGEGRPASPNNINNGIGNIDAVNGMGIWRSMNGGGTWEQLVNTNNNNFWNVAKIVVTNTGRVFAATGNGIWTSTNNGQTWTLEPAPVNAGIVQDLEIAANGDIFAGINGTGIFRLQNGMWAPITAGLPTTGFLRVELACASSSNRVYALFENSVGRSCLGIFTTADGSMNNNWTACGNPTMWVSMGTAPNFTNGAAWYNLIAAVDPNNENRVFIGGVDLFLSGDTGANWTQITQWFGGGGFQFVHADQHAIVFRAGSSTEMLFGNDGGVWYCTNGNAMVPTIQERNSGYNVTQFYANAIHPTAGSNYMLGGTQDNGTQRFNMAGINSTIVPDLDISGDGGYCFIDQDNANIQIGSYINHDFALSTDGGGSFNDLLAANNNTLFITPAEYDDGANVLYVSDMNNTFGRVVDVGGANTFTTEAVAVFGNGRATALTVSPSTANRLFVGTETGRIVRVENANQPGLNSNMPAPAAIGPAQLLGNWISCIAVDPGNDNHLLVTSSNYGSPHLMETTDGGANWVNLTALAPAMGGLPDMPVRWVMFHPFDVDKVLIATDLGVWSTDDLDGTATQWWPTNNFGLANVRVDMFQYRPSDHLVAAASHGRGMYTTDYFTLLNTCVANLNVPGAIAPGIYMAEDVVSSDGTIAPNAKVIFHAGDYISLTPNFWAQQGSDFWALILECNVGPKPAEDNPLIKSLLAGERKYEGQNAQGLRLRCYPNPVTYRLFVTFDLPTDGEYSLYVRNLQGRLIQTFASQEFRGAGEYTIELDASFYDAGGYVLTLQTDKTAVSERFIVAR